MFSLTGRNSFGVNLLSTIGLSTLAANDFCGNHPGNHGLGTGALSVETIVETMPEAPYNAIEHHAPWIKDFSYDPATDTFRNVQSGRGYSRTDFVKLAREDGARNAYTGATTLERAVIAGSVLQAANEQTRWREFLAGLEARRGESANRLKIPSTRNAKRSKPNTTAENMQWQNNAEAKETGR